MSGPRWRIGVVGCGWVAGLWLDHLSTRNDVEIVGYVDPDEPSSQARHASYGGGPVHANLTALLATAPDVVLNLTPPEQHASVTVDALRAGCHVLTEKPLAITVAEAAVIVTEAEMAQRSVAVMQNRRYARGQADLHRLVRLLDHPFLLSADMFVPWTFGGFRDHVESPLLTDMAIHTFDQARHLTGRRPAWVHCHELRLADSWMAGDATAVATFGFEGGTVFAYRGSWSAPGAETSWNAAWRATSARGTVTWDGDSSPLTWELVGSGTPSLRDDAEDRGALEDETSEHGRAIDDMLAAWAENRVPDTDAADNLWSVAMVEGALRSARLARRVLMSELTEP